MSRREGTLAPDYFDGLYAADADPWRFATSDYERAKYEATLAALPHEIYRDVLEIGCSIGVLTRQLAPRCEKLLALDVAAKALDQARARCADLAHVAFAQRQVPADWPAGLYDLILLSEVVYYLDRHDVMCLAEKAAAASCGDVVLVHWLGATDYPMSGDEAAELFIRCSADRLRVLHQSRTDQYRLDVLRTAGDAGGDNRRAGVPVGSA